MDENENELNHSSVHKALRIINQTHSLSTVIVSVSIDVIAAACAELLVKEGFAPTESVSSSAAAEVLLVIWLDVSFAIA